MILAQIDISKLFNEVSAQFGIFTALTLILVIGVLLILRNQENAKITRKEAETKQIVEDTKRDSLISDLAIKQGKTEDELRTVVVELAESRGQVKLLDSQLQAEREKRQTEREELKASIRLLQEKHQANEGEIAKLKEDNNGKSERIRALELEISNLNFQLADANNRELNQRGNLKVYQDKSVQLEAEIEALKAERDKLQAEIATSPTASKLEPTQIIPDMSDKVVTVTTETIITEARKELSANSEEEIP